MLLIVGLGNPGMKYKSTYHNVGFQVIDKLAKKLKVKVDKKECDARTVKGNIDGAEFVLAKPGTYMNLSGEVVKKLVRTYGVDPKHELIVIYDDIDLPLGKLRLKEEGSSGTHNGMRNIVAELNTTSFIRLRVGIKSSEYAENGGSLADYVLSNVAFDNKTILDEAETLAAEAVFELIEGKDIQRVQEKINRNKR